MPIPTWLTKWIQQEDDEFADVVCNDGVSLHTLLDNTINTEASLQQSLLNRYNDGSILLPEYGTIIEYTEDMGNLSQESVEDFTRRMRQYNNTADASYINQIWTEDTDVTRPTLDASEE